MFNQCARFLKRIYDRICLADVKTVSPEEIVRLPRACTFDCSTFAEFEFNDDGDVAFVVGGIITLQRVTSITRCDRGLVIHTSEGQDKAFRLMMPLSWRTFFVEDVVYRLNERDKRECM